MESFVKDFGRQRAFPKNLFNSDNFNTKSLRDWKFAKNRAGEVELLFN